MDKRWIRAGLLLAVTAMLMPAAQAFADEEADGPAGIGQEDWSTVKSLYREDGGDARHGHETHRPRPSDGPSFIPPDWPSVAPPVWPEPSCEAIQLPDGRMLNIVEVLHDLRAKHPELALWDEPEMQTMLLSERGFGDFFKWIVDHVKFSISGFGLTITLTGIGEQCWTFIYNWGLGYAMNTAPC